MNRGLAAGVLAKVGILLWLWWHRLPHYGADGVQLRGPVFEVLRTGRYLLRSAEGLVPYANEFFSAFPPGYTFVLIPLTWLTGPSLAAMLALDFAVHLAVAAVSALIVWKATLKVWAANVALFGAFGLLLPLGRPEELGILAVLAAGAAVMKRTPNGAVGAAIGVAALLGPTLGIKAVFLCLALAWCSKDTSKDLIKRAVVWGAVAALVVAVGWGSLTWGHFGHSLEQFSAFRKASFLPSLGETLRGQPALIIVGLLPLVALFVWGPHAAVRVEGKRAWVAVLIRAARLALPAQLALSAVMSRPAYDLRLELAIGGIAGLLVAGVLADGGRRRILAMAAVGVWALGTLALGQVLWRFALAPAVGGGGSYESVLARVLAQIPENATAGGDGAFIEVGAHRVAYFDLNNTAKDHWPEFLVSSTWSDPPYVLQRSQEKVAAEYELVEHVMDPYTPGCALRVAGLKAPLARGSCGWNALVWKRRADVH